MQKLDNLKNTIENEMLAIDKEYERVNDEATKSYKIKREKLDKEEEDLKDKLKNEVTKIKETLENNLSKVNNLFKSCEKIKKGIKSLEKEEKYILQTLSYISSINKSKTEMNSLINTEMINLKITFNEKESDIEFDKYYFNGDKIKNIDNDEYIDIDNEKPKERKLKKELDFSLIENPNPISPEISDDKKLTEEPKILEEAKPIEEKAQEKKSKNKKNKKFKTNNRHYNFEEPKEEKVNIMEEPKEQLNYYNTIEEPKEEKVNIFEEPKEQLNYYNTIEMPKNEINYYSNKTEEKLQKENYIKKKNYFPFYHKKSHKIIFKLLLFEIKIV